MIPTKRPAILVVDDDAAVRRLIRSYLSGHTYTVVEAENGRAGLQVLEKKDVDIILADLQMPVLGGLELLSEVRRQDPDLPVIVISGAGDIDEVVQALHLGANDFLLKPIDDLSILHHEIEKCLERAELIRERKRYQEMLETEVAKKTGELTSLNERLRAVVDSTQKLLGCGELQESGPMILNEFAQHMNAAGGSIYEVFETRLHWIHSLDKGHAYGELALPLSPGTIFARALQNTDPLIIEDVSKEEFLLSGWQEYTGPSCMMFPFKDREGQIFALLALHSPRSGRFDPQDREIGIILSSSVSEALQTANAVAAMKRSEELMLQSQKLEAVGTLAGGIAHDFNNILSAIVGYTDLSLYSPDCSEPLQKNLTQVKKASQRARDLVHQILSFSRVEASREAPIDIGPIVKEALQLLRASIPSSISIQKNIPDGLGLIQADPGRIHQVLMNLCTNASHSMQDRDGVLRVDFSRIDVDPGEPSLGKLSGKTCLRLSISDSGHGISPEIAGRIFDPYYTTKEKGEGTGLGLAVVHGIVRGSGGMMVVDSEVGRGTTFHAYFPCVEDRGELPQRSSDYQMPLGDERILFIDDEETLAEMAGEMLKKLGYTVKVMTSSVDAMRLLEQDLQKFDLIITDQTMPILTGLELARKVMTMRPDMPIVLYTGYSAAISEKEAREIGIKKVLMKPLSMTLLSQAVRNVIDDALADQEHSPSPDG